MSKFDFSKVQEQIARSESAESAKTGYKYKLIYPSEGSLNIRILFNPKSGLITRLVNRHNIGGTRVPCMATYTKKDDCPICKVLNQAAEAGITLPYSTKSTVRAIFFAQFHSATYDVGEINKGDIIKVMVPWSVYKDIQKFLSDLSQSPDAMYRAFETSSYFAFTIEKGKGNQDWSGRINPVITVKSAESDEEFIKMLEDIDSLYDAVANIHETCTEEDLKLMNETADQLRTQLFSPETQELQPKLNNEEPTPALDTTKVPVCYGTDKYVPESNDEPSKAIQRIKCKMCEYKDSCSEVPF